MDKSENNNKTTPPKNNYNIDEASKSKIKSKIRGTKRKRIESDSSSSSSSSDVDGILPENMLETEKNLHASAVKNNLDEISVRKILKKVVTNDHVLALVKLREEEENFMGIEDKTLPPKFTRSKAKELMKVSTKTAPWNLELIPIKHIPVKTRPEVEALIAQELPEDEDDDEYQPTHDDVPSDDDITLESCSDLESQPRTPATSKSQQTSSPKVIKDGPFKVPQSVSATKRKLDLEEEEATIALRTRSKLSLSSTSIEHIESTFVPPDELPKPAVDDLWNQFLNECLNPASTSKNEEDDEADPEYNVAADPDAAEEDEEALGRSIIKISKKELNDLVTELFNILPDATVDDGLAENLANSVLTDNSQNSLPQWEGKQEPVSDEEASESISKGLTFEKRDVFTKVSVGKSEMEEPPDEVVEQSGSESDEAADQDDRNGRISTRKSVTCDKHEAKRVKLAPRRAEIPNRANIKPRVDISIKERAGASAVSEAPPLLRLHLQLEKSQTLQVTIGPDFKVLPEQLLILQQQIRQHIQMAASNFLQLYVHPVHWNLAPAYKEYLETFRKMCDSNPDSVVNVCNLKPAIELMACWEKTVSKDTPENKAMVKFVHEESERCRRRVAQNNGYSGEFHETFMKVVSNSTVFLYPYLLPPLPYRPDFPRKTCYMPAEDELIALGLEQFWQYVDRNPQMYKLRKKRPHQTRMGMGFTVTLLSKHMLPWLAPSTIRMHVQQMKRHGFPDNPIYKFAVEGKPPAPVKHELLPFNPKLTLYEQPANEMPRVWLRYLAKNSRRFKNYLHRSGRQVGITPQGVPVDTGKPIEIPLKNPLPIEFNKGIIGNRSSVATPTVADKFDLQINNPKTSEINSTTEITTAQTTEIDAPKTTQNVMVATNLFTVVQTSTGAVLVPLTMLSNTNTVDSTSTPITTPKVNCTDNDVPAEPGTTQQKEQDGTKVAQMVQKEIELKKRKEISERTDADAHCECCKLLRKICKKTQKLMTDYFGSNKTAKRVCSCKGKSYPKTSNRLRLFMNYYKSQTQLTLHEIESKLNETGDGLDDTENEHSSYLEDLTYVTSYHVRLSKFAEKCRATRRRELFSIFERFSETADLATLMDELYTASDKNFNDLYKDFFGLLTAEQADDIGAFKNYFSSRVKNLISKIQEEIMNTEARENILKEIKSVLYGENDFTSCEICAKLLALMHDCPRLAQYTFSLFPHMKYPSCTQDAESPVKTQEIQNSPAKHDQSHQNDNAAAERVELTAMDVEPDYAITDVDENSSAESVIYEEPQVADLDAAGPIKIESQPGDAIVRLITAVKNEPETEEYSSCDSPDAMVILEEDIKSEELEWTRDEDKIVLEVLKQCLTPEERKDKTIIEILDEKRVFEMVSQNLNDKSPDDVKERMLYLLEILVLTEN